MYTFIHIQHKCLQLFKMKKSELLKVLMHEMYVYIYIQQAFIQIVSARTNTHATCFVTCYDGAQRQKTTTTMWCCWVKNKINNRIHSDNCNMALQNLFLQEYSTSMINTYINVQISLNLRIQCETTKNWYCTSDVK